jgi:hypothetical protein
MGDSEFLSGSRRTVRRMVQHPGSKDVDIAALEPLLDLVPVHALVVGVQLGARRAALGRPLERHRGHVGATHDALPYHVDAMVHVLGKVDKLGRPVIMAVSVHIQRPSNSFLHAF